MRGAMVARWVMVCVVLFLVAGVFVMRSRQTTSKVSSDSARSGRESSPGRAAVTRVDTRAAAAAAARRTAPRARLVIAGRVTLPDGRPAVHAAVTATRFEPISLRDLQMRSVVSRPVVASISAVVDADGKYRIETQETSMHRLDARLAGYATGVATLDRGEPPASAEVRSLTRDISLVPSAAMSGRVVDDAGQAVAGAVIAAMPEGRMWRGGGGAAVTAEITSSSASGAFAFDCFTSSAVVFAARAEGYVPFSGTVQLPKENMEIVLKRGGASVEGVVRLKATGEPVAHARVAAATDTRDFGRLSVMPPAETLSGADGTFRIANLAAGSYRLLGSKDKLQTYISVAGTRGRVRLAENENATDREVLLYMGHTVTGRVTEEGSKKGLARFGCRRTCSDLPRTPPAR